MSPFNSVAPYAAGLVAGVLVLVLLRRQPARCSLPLPPGPKPLPIIGNLLDIPREKEWLTYRSWNQKYGDIVFIEALGQKIVILGSAIVVNDLMEKRSTVYSDRPGAFMLNHLMGFGWLLSMQPYGELWRRGRKLLHGHVHQGVTPQYQPVQLESARRFIREILLAKTDKDALPHAIKSNFGRSIIRMVYGIDADSDDSEYISLPNQVLENISEASTPGRFLVDFLPILKYVPSWFPGAGFRRYAEKAQGYHRRMRDKPIDVVTAEMANGTAPRSMSRAMLEEDAALPPAQSQYDLIKDVTGIAYLGGSDTTAAAIVSFFLAMLVYPDVQAKAQAEVDQVIGKDRLPEFDDMESMPYVQCVASECLRWLPVLPLSVPHATSQDDKYNGYLIPKGSTVMGSIWSILHNAEDYPEPDMFKPERYLTADGKINPTVRDPRTACFGFGRRICPGRHIADASLFAMLSTILATINVVRAKDAQGHEIIPNVDVNSGLLSHAKPFVWSVRSRSRHAEELVASVLAH